MKAYVVVATKGRSAVLESLVQLLESQRVRPSKVWVVGTTPADVESLREHPAVHSGFCVLTQCPRVGLCSQRNWGLQLVEQDHRSGEGGRYFVAFFDDDFRPDVGWIEEAGRAFEEQPDLVGITGHVLADGINGAPIDEDAALEYLRGRLEPMMHWASGDEPRPVASAYGCNMAFVDTVLGSCQFDENLPLYGWQEDRDYAGQAHSYGRVMYWPQCRGVHLGVKSGRVSGVRFGYSQVANTWYLSRKGTMSPSSGLAFATRNFIANSVRSTLLPDPAVDHRGRLRGNLMALHDLVKGQCDPRKILQL